MRVYVASKFENTLAVQVMHQVLREAGHEITHDWTVEDLAAENDVNLALECAIDDVEGVENADAVVLLMHPNMKGAWVEVGIALARFIPIIIVGGPRFECIFERLPSVAHVDDAAGVLRALENLSASFDFPLEQVKPLVPHRRGGR